jgi:hypothetical protein
MAETAEIDTANQFLVGVQGKAIVIRGQPSAMTKAEALTFAAWLVVLADDEPPHRFLSVLEAVQNT